jgi:Ca-activated chloride channel family protein
MLSNDVQPNRLERVKLATQDLINQLQGDRVGLIAFAGRAFVQAPLTIDYEAVVEAINDLNTETIPEGGTNISEAISLADKTYGKSATGNRALVILTDGEELSGDAVKTAKAAADAGVRIFTIGVGTPQGSLIPLRSDDTQNVFVKDSNGQVVKSRLDEKRLQEIAQTAAGFYLHLENGPRTMQQLVSDGISKMKAAEIDVRLARRPIERYEWPLGLAVLLLGSSIVLGERKGARRRARAPGRELAAATATALFLLALPRSFASAPGLDAYRKGDFEGAYGTFQETLKAHPQNSAADKLNFDSGAAAYKMKDYAKALDAFSQALLSPDQGLQSKSHYNLGNTLYERGESEKSDEKKLLNWTNALQHYEQTLKLDGQNKEAKENYEFVTRKIDELKNKQPPPSPTPSPSPKQDKKEDQKKSDQKNQDQQQQQQDQQDKQRDQQQQSSSGGQDQQQKPQQQQQQDQSGADQKEKDQKGKDQSENKDQKEKDQKGQMQAGQSPSPSPGDSQSTASPSPGGGDEKKDDSQGESGPSPTPSDKEGGQPTSSPGSGQGSGTSGAPSPPPNPSPNKKFSGDIKGNSGDDSGKPPAEAEAEAAAEAEPEKEGQLSERQARALLESMKDEEARVQLDERRAVRRVYKDW